MRSGIESEGSAVKGVHSWAADQQPAGSKPEKPRRLMPWLVRAVLAVAIIGHVVNYFDHIHPQRPLYSGVRRVDGKKVTITETSWRENFSLTNWDLTPATVYEMDILGAGEENWRIIDSNQDADVSRNGGDIVYRTLSEKTIEYGGSTAVGDSVFAQANLVLDECLEMAGEDIRTPNPGTIEQTPNYNW
jgi:hypothetical protein